MTICNRLEYFAFILHSLKYALSLFWLQNGPKEYNNPFGLGSKVNANVNPRGYALLCWTPLMNAALLQATGLQTFLGFFALFVRQCKTLQKAGLSCLLILILANCGGGFVNQKPTNPLIMKDGFDNSQELDPAMAILVGRAFAPTNLSLDYDNRGDQHGNYIYLEWRDTQKKSPLGPQNIMLFDEEYRTYKVPAGVYYLSYSAVRFIRQEGNYIVKYTLTTKDAFDPLTKEPRYGQIELKPGEIVYIGDLATMLKEKTVVTSSFRIIFHNYDRYEAAQSWFKRRYPKFADRLQKKLFDFGVLTLENET